MDLFSNLKHYNDIIWLFYKYGKGDLLKELGSQVNLSQILKERGEEKGKAEDLVKDLEALGPFYIKLGQILSAEAFALPPEYEIALQKLQDQATPMPFEDVESVFLSEFGQSPSKIFKEFDKDPFSAASLGQVHKATLLSGKIVAVKVQRKEIQQTILEQLDALYQFCSFLESNTDWGKRYHVTEKVQNLKVILLNEMDYRKEAANLLQMSSHLKEFEHLFVPLPIEDYSSGRILTMDFIEGQKITSLHPLEKLNFNGKLLAKELFQSFLKQILVDGFFQMGPHPGNIYLTVKDEKPCLALLDLGMVAHIPFEMQGQLIRCLFALAEGKEIEVTKILVALGKKLPDFDEYLFRNKISDVMASYRGHTVSEVPMGRIILNLSYAAGEVGLWLPIQFSTIGKTLVSIFPVLKALDPDFDPNSLLKESACGIMRKRLTQQFTYQSLYGSFLEGVEFLEHLPSKLNELFDVILKSDYQIKVKFPDGPKAKHFEKIANRITMGLILAALVISAAFLMQIETPFKILGYPGFAMVLFTLAAAGSFFLLFNILWNDRKKE